MPIRRYAPYVYTDNLYYKGIRDDESGGTDAEFPDSLTFPAIEVPASDHSDAWRSFLLRVWDKYGETNAQKVGWLEEYHQCPLLYCYSRVDIASTYLEYYYMYEIPTENKILSPMLHKYGRYVADAVGTTFVLDDDPTQPYLVGDGWYVSGGGVLVGDEIMRGDGLWIARYSANGEAFPDCGFYIRWLNHLGGIDYYMFRVVKEWTEETERELYEIDSYSGDVHSRHFRSYREPYTRRVVVHASQVPYDDFENIKRIPESPWIYVSVVDETASSGRAWKRATLDTTSFTAKASAQRVDVEMTFLLPRNVTI